MYSFKYYRSLEGEFYYAESPLKSTDKECPIKKNENDVFDEYTWTWKSFIKDFEIYKEEVIGLITKYRQQEEYAGPYMIVNGEEIRVPTKLKDESRLTTVADILKEYPMIDGINDWKIKDGLHITIDLEFIKMINFVCFIHVSNTFTIERDKLAEINNLTTNEELDEWVTTSLDTGWTIEPSILVEMYNAITTGDMATIKNSPIRVLNIT